MPKYILSLISTRRLPRSHVSLLANPTKLCPRQRAPPNRLPGLRPRQHPPRQLFCTGPNRALGVTAGCGDGPVRDVTATCGLNRRRGVSGEAGALVLLVPRYARWGQGTA